MGERLPKNPAERADCPSISHRIEDLQPGHESVMRWEIGKLFHLDRGQPYTARVTRLRGLPAATPSGQPLRRWLSRVVTVKQP